MLAHSKWIGIVSVSVLANAVVVALPARTENYPSKPVRIINPAPAGNSLDIIGRIVADRLTRAWGQQVLMVNRPGAGGLLAAQAAVKAEPDGYTLYQTNTSTMLVLPVTQKLSFDVGRDLVPISLIGQEPIFIAVAPSLGVNTLPELIALAKKRPGEVLYSASVRGNFPHLVGEWFSRKAGIELTHVPYPSVPHALHDVAGGRISMIVGAYSNLGGAIEAGNIKLIATTSARRLPNLPALPTVAELIPDFAVSGWFGLMAPAGTADEIVQKLNHDLHAVLAEAEVQKRFLELGAYVRPMSPAETAEFIRREQQLWWPVVKQLDLMPQ